MKNPLNIKLNINILKSNCVWSAKTAVVALTCLLSACTGFFDKDNTPAPTPLTNYHPEVFPQLLWIASATAGSSSHDYLKMSPAVGESAVYIAGNQGTVTAFNKQNGSRLWHADTGVKLTSGPGIGEGLVIVGGQNGQVIALLASNGREVWRAAVPGQVIATPAIGGGYVIVKATDGYTRALSTRNGKEQWSFAQTEPNLILRGSSAPIIHDQEVIAGYANGNLAKLSLTTGELLWLQTIAIPEGAFAIQRMIDIDADPVVYQHHLYAATFQGKITALDWNSGRSLWTHDISSYTGMAADSSSVYITDAAGYVWDFGADSGTPNWRQYLLKYRILSGPALLANYVVVGDAQGYLHWLSKTDGHLAGRQSLGSAITASPIAENNVLYVLTKKGYLYAYTLDHKPSTLENPAVNYPIK